MNMLTKNVHHHHTIQEKKWKSAGKVTSIFLGAFAIGSVIGSVLGIKTVKAPGHKWAPNERLFLKKRKEFAVLEQAVERIYPTDQHGPGAIQLRVPHFIDKQLASSWGINAKDYRKPPFVNEQPEVGQSALTIREIFMKGLRKMNAVSLAMYQVSFDQASEEQQINILKKFENNEVELSGVQAGSFFTLLRETTLEGVYADPLYDGNKNMAGWKMKAYPGARYSYKEIVEHPDFVCLDPVDVTRHRQLFLEKEGKNHD